jgi:hypothetical protein
MDKEIVSVTCDAAPQAAGVRQPSHPWPGQYSPESRAPPSRNDPPRRPRTFEPQVPPWAHAAASNLPGRHDEVLRCSSITSVPYSGRKPRAVRPSTPNKFLHRGPLLVTHHGHLPGPGGEVACAMDACPAPAARQCPSGPSGEVACPCAIPRR